MVLPCGLDGGPVARVDGDVDVLVEALIGLRLGEERVFRPGLDELAQDVVELKDMEVRERDRDLQALLRALDALERPIALAQRRRERGDGLRS